MEISKNSSTSFSGIKLSNTNIDSVREIVSVTQKTGFKLLGQKTIYCNNTISDKINAAKGLRKKATFSEKEFGIVNFPWSKETYLMASPECEQFMLPLVKQYDKGAVLNLLI